MSNRTQSIVALALIAGVAVAWLLWPKPGERSERASQPPTARGSTATSPATPALPSPEPDKLSSADAPAADPDPYSWTLTGRLVHTSGQPLIYTTVYSLTRTGGDQYAEFPIETDGEGRFSIAGGLPGRNWELSLARGAHTMRVPPPTRNTGVLDFGDISVAGALVEFRALLDGEALSPTASVQVTVPLDGVWPSCTFPGDRTCRMVIPQARLWFEASLVPHEAATTAFVPPVKAGFVARVTQPALVTIRFSRARVIPVRVVDPGGVPLDARVSWRVFTPTMNWSGVAGNELRVPTLPTRPRMCRSPPAVTRRAMRPPAQRPVNSSSCSTLSSQSALPP